MDRVKGLAFLKADLHVHTPKSLCYGEPSVTLEQIVDTALDVGLEIMGITDHNTVEAIDDIRAVARQKGLVIFPGVELSTRGGHVIALFELDTSVADMQDFISDVGLPPGAQGDGTVMTESDIEDVFQKIHERGGLSIAAHIERWPSGFLETNEPRRVKIRIHGNSYLSALEITVPQNKSLWNTGQMRDYPRKYACIQGSDAHAPEEIGRRWVYIQMEPVNLQGLRLAFADHQTRIVFPEELASSK
jgi:PHP family Zn ribbon phosphoesterase